MKVYSKHSRRQFCTYCSQDKLDRMSKKIGNVYAIQTSRGMALGQVVDVEKRNGIYLCRIFRKLYALLPENISEIMQTKEDYIIQIMLPSMARGPKKLAIKLGKYDIPSHYKFPDYTKSCTAFGTEATSAPMKYWHIIPDYLALCELVDKDIWITEYLGKDVHDPSWKEEFKKLNPGGIYFADGLIELLESGFDLETWVPSDFDKPVETFF